MKYNVKYISALETVNLTKSPFICRDIQPLFEEEISYTATNYIFNDRSFINKFYFEGNEKKIAIQILGNNKAELLNHLEYLFNYDRHNLKPGRLYVNDNYAYCYFISSSPEEFNRFFSLETVNYKIYFCSRWIKEKVYDFNIEHEYENKGNFKYPYSYPFSYNAVKKIKHIINDHYCSCKAKIEFYGPCVNPFIKIGENIYSVDTELIENEKLEIDPFEKTVIKYTSDGTAIDCMNYRYKKKSVFSEIETGLNICHINGGFACRIILYMERSIPEWK
ncbi:hypothetical protein [Thomasclavelia cocleata]|uniref:hypothetical protein n=1 Tax=Thomasclavelia cocleata TaxID=69824 RepID=UPI0024321516|nr:hypothetical protein [Thomasclavelia cocleata]